MREQGGRPGPSTGRTRAAAASSQHTHRSSGSSFSTLGAGDRLGVTETRKMSTDISLLTFKSGFLATWPGLSRDGSGWIWGPCSITVRTFHLTGPWF